jgi:hypothetical protein
MFANAQTYLMVADYKNFVLKNDLIRQDTGLASCKIGQYTCFVFGAGGEVGLDFEIMAMGKDM